MPRETYYAEETAKSLRDVAADLERDAKKLRFAAQIDEALERGDTFEVTVFNQNVNRLLMSTMSRP